MSDLIDRRDAIDAITTWDKFGVDERSRIVTWYEGLEPYVHLRDVVTAIINLPSAQPDIIRCKDCKYWSEYEYINGKLELFPWCELNMTFSKEDDFCSHAERRSDE